ncbi:methyltransferase family protein [Marinobacterium rhizophilum]|uniref:Isoprenylcysteine carboxylmethyltransferase family protein n=1 Tax=Marinobacterium rhizophilum TaxID=420402 RepID=A0ABY5HL99_9GAMM|nr:isoprenylcysteine carboxylmethyltransferase family protein [Marinobacterium rhizophilum]UTW12734.1 isoprenylcysteine carboxylmethyltransferase family protein [Marinobacterium rhizophilum]
MTVDQLETKVPPLAIVLICALCMIAIARVFPGPAPVADVGRVLAVFCLLAGGFLAVAGVLAFRRAQTTVDPMLHRRATALVTTGVYSITRNPMYVGLLFVLLALGCYLSSPYAMVMCVLFVLYMNRFQIRPEEALLESIFKDAYRAYRARVRRWL